VKISILKNLMLM